MSFKGAKQAVTAFAPKIEAARPKDRPALIDAMLTVIAYHRVGNRPGTLGAAGAEKPAKARVPADAAASRGQAGGQSLEMVLS